VNWRERWGERWGEAVIYSAKVFVAVRIVLFALSFIAMSGSMIIPSRSGVLGVPGWPEPTYTPGWHNLFTAFQHQDALWYLHIATIGYKPLDGSAAFFPLYPYLIRIVSPLLGGHPLAAALLISHVCFFLALVFLYDLTRTEFSQGVARRTVLYISIFPTAFFFFAPYSESTFLLFSVLAFWGARNGKWPVAGIAGFLAALTRSIGVFVAVGLALEAILQRREKGGLAHKLFWSAVAASGLAAYLGYWQWRAGDWSIPLHLQTYWQRQKMFPLETLWNATRYAFDPTIASYWLMDWLIVVPMIAALVWGIWKYRLGYSAYAWLAIVAPLSLVYTGRPLMSDPRFVLVLFPAFWVIALLTEKRGFAHEVVVALYAGGLALLSVMFMGSWNIF
jgi:hypothetical protein